MYDHESITLSVRLEFHKANRLIADMSDMSSSLRSSSPCDC